MPSRVEQGGQDWKPQAFNVRHTEDTGPSGKATESQANKVRQSGGSLSISKKTATNQTHAGAGARARALDDDHDSTRVNKIGHDVRVEIQRARSIKGMTQAQLAQAINERASVITEYENGKAVPNEGVLVRLEKALGVHLRGALAGQPMEAKTKK